MNNGSNKVWEQIYAQAWVDDGFKDLLESDLEGAVTQFAAQRGIPVADLLAARPSASVAGERLDDAYLYPPACC